MGRLAASRAMEVTFRKDLRHRTSSWEAVRPKGIRIPGKAWGLGRGGMPHDLVQLIVECAIGERRGFWGSIAAGASFRSTDRRRTNPGRQVIAANKATIDQVEGAFHMHFDRWVKGEPTPAAPHLDEIGPLWDGLGDGGSITIEWPTLRVLRVDAGADSAQPDLAPAPGESQGPRPTLPGLTRKG